MSGVINAPSRVCHVPSNIMWSVGNKFLYTLGFFSRGACLGICYNEILGHEKLICEICSKLSMFYQRVAEPFYVTWIKMCDFCRKNIHEKSSALSSTPQILFSPTRQHLYLLRTEACIQWWPWICMGKKQYSHIREGFTLGKCYIVCLPHALLAVL